ncbi:MAG: hypothetical protein V3S22_05380 [Candidatus Neomarinimicrobiota bacterium]
MNNKVRTIVLFFLITIFLDQSYAIPAFARKYKTSCATCHVGYPKLTPYGEAYRLLGFQLPEVEEESIKEEPVSMGSEGYKRVWPKAIWPGTIPGTSPISFRVRSGFSYSSADPEENTGFTSPSLQIMTGGTFSENISFLVGAHLFEGGEAGSVDRLYLKFDHLFSNVLPYNALYVRVGQFVPDIVTFITNHRSLTQSPYAFNTIGPNDESFAAGHAHGATSFGVELFQLGAEASGILAKRFRYVLGMVNGNGVAGENNADKDVYYKLGYKAGGMAFDGSSAGDIYGNSANNWAEKSVTISTFGYFGTGSLPPEDDPVDAHKVLYRTQSITSEGHSDTGNFNFRRLGADVNIFLRDLNLFGGYINGFDSDENYSLYFAEANYMIFPWLIGVVRYEQSNPENLDSFSQVIAHVTALYTANIKLIIESRINPEDPGLNNLVMGLDYAF